MRMNLGFLTSVNMKFLAVALVSLGLCSCQTTPEVKQLQADNSRLEKELGQAREDIQRLQGSEQRLQAEVDELNRVIGVLDVEKQSRTTESAHLRGQVRGFVQQQIDGFKEFLVAGNLLDYVGGELVERATSDTKPLMLVDLHNRIPRTGTLTGVGGHFLGATQLVVKVLRPIDQSLVVIWESPLLKVAEPGVAKVSFPVAVGWSLTMWWLTRFPVKPLLALIRALVTRAM